MSFEKMEISEEELRRKETLSKRSKELFKEADELRSETGAKVAIVINSASDKQYVYGDIYAAIDAATSRSESSSGGGSSLVQKNTPTEDMKTDLKARKLLDEVNVEDCDDLEKLLEYQKQLEEIKIKLKKRLS